MILDKMNIKTIKMVLVPILMVLLSFLSWAFSDTKALQGSLFALVLVSLVIWRINFKSPLQILWTAFFVAAGFITVFLIIQSHNGAGNKAMEDNVGLYGIVGGSFFWSGVLAFIIRGCIKNKKDWSLWKHDFKEDGIIVGLNILAMFVCIAIWATSYYIWAKIGNDIVRIVIPALTMSALLIGTLFIQNEFIDKKIHSIYHDTNVTDHNIEIG